MADRRMFAKTIIDSDAFLDMPATTQTLYFHLSMRADDEGFINNPKKIQRVVGSSDDDLKLLIAKRFVIPFESGIVVIKHWKIHNYIRKDRLQETVYQDEKRMLEVKDNGAYTLRQSNVGQVADECQHRLGKDRLGKDRIDKREGNSRFAPPSFDDVCDYCLERNNGIDAQAFIDFYESKGWMIGKNKMKDWKAAVRTWERRVAKQGGNPFKEALRKELENEQNGSNGNNDGYQGGLSKLLQEPGRGQ